MLTSRRRCVAVRRRREVVVTLDGRPDASRATSCSSPWAGRRAPPTSGSTPSGLGLRSPAATCRSTTSCASTGADGWLYAVGDCNGRALLTHVGKYQARICGDVILGERREISPTTGSCRGSRSPIRRCARSGSPRRRRASRLAGAGRERADRGRGRRLRRGQRHRRDVRPGRRRGAAVAAGRHVHRPRRSRSCCTRPPSPSPGPSPSTTCGTPCPSFPTVSEVWLRLLEAYGL